MEDEHSKAQDEGRLEEQKDDARKHLREQEVRLAHWRRRHELQGLPDAGVDDRIADPPDAGREEVQADQPRKEKVDVARSSVADESVADGRRIVPPARL